MATVNRAARQAGSLTIRGAFDDFIVILGFFSMGQFL
jgi:hypothetical protein